MIIALPIELYFTTSTVVYCFSSRRTVKPRQRYYHTTVVRVELIRAILDNAGLPPKQQHSAESIFTVKQ